MVRLTLVATLLFGLVGIAAAQDAGADAGVDAATDPAAEAFRRAIDSDPWTSGEAAHDPLSQGSSEELASVVPDPDVEEAAAPIHVRHGDVMDAIPGVRVSRHTIAITLEGGLAVVAETLRFVSRAEVPAEAMVRLAVPDGARVVALHAENERGAREGVVTTLAIQGAYDDAIYVRSTAPSGLPVADARRLDDARGPAIVLRAAPIGRQGDASAAGSAEELAPLTVTLTWAMRAPMHGGVVRLGFPARGQDERMAPEEVSVTAVDVVEPRIDDRATERGALEIAPRAAFVLTALAPISRPPHLEGAVVPCAAGRCVRLRAVGGRAHVASGTYVVAVDASPSTAIGARGRITDAVRVLTSLLPRESHVRLVAFAARTEALGEGGPSALDLRAVRNATEAPLGSATRFSALWDALEPTLRAGDRVILVGDGGMTSGASETEAFAAAAARGVIVSAIDVADREPTRALETAVTSTHGAIVTAGAAADAASAGRGDAALAELLTRAVADPVAEVTARVDGRALSLGALRTGEELSWIGTASRVELSMGSQRLVVRAPDAAHAPSERAIVDAPFALTAVDPRDLDAAAGACAADGSPRARPTQRASSVAGHGRRIAPAHHRSCSVTTPAAATARESLLPARALRDHLRRRVIPPARACFRDDRMGRPRHHREVVFALTLADREVIEADVEGELPPDLRGCLLHAFDALDVPAFDGTLVVRWPVHTDAIPPPPTIELGPDVARMIGDLVQDEPLPAAPSL